MLDAKKCWKKGAQFVAVEDADTHLSMIRDHFNEALEHLLKSIETKPPGE
jgi:hypothetical protein